MEIIVFLGSVFQFLFIVFKEIFAAKERARIAQEKFELDEKKRMEIFQAALDKMRKTLPEQSHQAQDMDSKIDEELKGSKK